MELLTAIEAFQALKDGKEVECKFVNLEEWKTLTNDCAINVLLNTNVQFRLAQEMITIRDVSFPKPEVDIPSAGTSYYSVNMNYNGFAGPHKWCNNELDLEYLKRGMLHLTKENAIAHAKALITLSGGSI